MSHRAALAEGVEVEVDVGVGGGDERALEALGVGCQEQW